AQPLADSFELPIVKPCPADQADVPQSLRMGRKCEAAGGAACNGKKVPAPHSRPLQKFTRFEIAPSTTRFDPVVNDDDGLARTTAALAICCGVAMGPVGLRASVSE